MTYFHAKFHIPLPNSSLLNAGNHKLKKMFAQKQKCHFTIYKKLTSPFKARIKGPVYNSKDPRLKWPPITLHVLG
jgi:hypothetical protein